MTFDPGATSHRLTNTAIEALKPGQSLKDDRVPGLSIRAHATGRSWMFYYRTKTGIERRPKIGSYPLIKISAARDLARKFLSDVAGGGDPVLDRKIERDAPTMDQLWKRVEEEHYNSGKEWDKDAKRIYDKFIKPKLGKRRVRSIAYDDVKAIHVAMKDMPTRANHTLAVLSCMLGLAERFGPPNRKWRDRHTNPCELVERYPLVKRRRFATKAEMAKIGKILARYAEDETQLHNVAFLYLLMYSGARPSEIENGTPAMLERVETEDGNVCGVLRLEHGKTGPRDVFLPPQAMAVLERLPKDRKSLAGTRTLPKKLWQAVREEAGCPDLWARDMRRTFATQALSNGIPIGVVGELLGHASTQTTKIYAKLIEDSAHAAAATVAGRMEKLLNGG